MWPIIRYPNITLKNVCDDENMIHAWNRFKNSLGKINWYRNHFNLPDKHREFVGGFLIYECHLKFRTQNIICF